jgi:hypothetical protein
MHVGDLDEHYRTDGMESLLAGIARCVWPGDAAERPLQTAGDLSVRSVYLYISNLRLFSGEWTATQVNQLDAVNSIFDLVLPLSQL